MNTPLITWCCIAAIALLIVMVRVYGAVTAQRSHALVRKRADGHPHHRILEMGRECEEFYIPGDIAYRRDSDNDFGD